MSAENNRQRAFADAITVDAWHDKFEGKQASVDLHADVSFDTARVGGEQESAVRFRLSIKRAELVVVISETEPVRVDRSSVARSFERKKHKHKEKISTKQEAELKGAAKTAASIHGVDASASLSADGKFIVSKENTTETKEEVVSMKITQSQTAEGFYRWIVEERKGKALIGKPWEADRKPRLKLIDQRTNKSGIAPVVIVEVRCRREDLIIEEIELKDQNVWQKITSGLSNANKMIAVEAYIRDRLAAEGLSAGDVTDKFAQLTMANVIASEE